MRKVIGVVLGVCVALTLAAIPAQARVRAPECFKWNGQRICLVVPIRQVPVPKGTVIHDGGGWLV